MNKKSNGVHILQITQTTTERKRFIEAKERYRKKIGVKPAEFNKQMFLDILLDCFEKHKGN